MSALALLLVKFGVKVSGADRTFSEKLLELSDAGVKVYVGSHPEAIGDAELVVYSSAIHPECEELEFCRVCNIPTMERHVFLGEISEAFEHTIAVAGTHGKTTATSMLAKVVMDASVPFCAHIGGEASGIGNFFYSGSRYFVTEACEYRRSLLSLKPYIAVVLNAESDHPDTYKDLDDLYSTFDAFIASAKYTVINGDTKYYKDRQFCDKSIITFGTEKNNQYTLTAVTELENGCYSYDLEQFGIPVCHVELGIEGYHNIYNSAAAIIAASLMRICVPGAAMSIHNFGGVARRFEKLGLCQGALVISDYAHHPTEIKAVINTARKKLRKNGKLYAVFQPHTYSRTFSLFSEFLKCFDDTESLVVCKEYSARETPDMGISARQLFDNIEHKEKHYYDNILDAAAYLIERVLPDDIVLILGAGDIDNLGKILLME